MNRTTLLAQPFDLRQLRLSGTPAPVAEEVATSGIIPPVGAFSVSEQGSIAYRTGSTPLGSQLTWYGNSGTLLKTVGTRGDYNDLSMSRDGRWASLSVREPGRQERRIAIVDLERDLMSSATNGGGTEQASTWFTDNRIAFNRDRGQMDLIETTPAIPGRERVLLGSDFNRALERVPLTVSPDNKTLLFRVGGRFPAAAVDAQQSSSVRIGELWLLPLDGAASPRRFLESSESVWDAEISSDGHWVTYEAEQSGVFQIYVTTYPTPTQRVRISPHAGTQPHWSADSRKLYFLDGGLWVARLDLTGGHVRVTSTSALFTTRTSGPQRHYAVAPDGRFLFNVQAGGTQDPASPITVALNWTGLLQ
jgi:hypothetical protein